MNTDGPEKLTKSMDRESIRLQTLSDFSLICVHSRPSAVLFFHGPKVHHSNVGGLALAEVHLAE